MSIKRKKRERLSNLEQTSAWLGPLVQSEPSAQVVVAALMRHDCWQLSVQLGNILNSQSQRPAWGPEDQNQWDWPCPRSHSFTPVYTNITDAHECLPHRGQMLLFFSSEICFLRIDSDSLADVILFFVFFLLVLLLFLPLSGQRRRVSSDQPLLLWYTAAGKEGRKVSVLLFCGCIFHFWSRQRFIRIKPMSIFDLHLWRDESNSCWPSFEIKRFVFVAGFTPMERREENFKVKVSYHFY